jgi:FtsP/CotA-like multicopper oxidase with cupredoxin domain
MSKRREKTDAKWSRRELIKTGLLSGGVALGASKGIRAAAAALQTTQSPPTTPFVEELPIMPEAQPAPGLVDPLPNAANHQRYNEFLPQKFYEINQVEALHSFHPELPPNPIWGYNGVYPGPTFRARYGEPALVRFHNNLPPNHVGFGIPSVITHLHNGHTASESDGFPGDFYEVGQFKDHHYPNTYAGGDEREALSTLWYHDHRVDFTSQNVYKGLAGFYLLFDERDSGDEQDTNPQALRLPSGEFDVPLIFQDMRFTADGEQFYDSFNNNDGLLGDKFLVNGKIQPFMRVISRKYRFRLLNGSLSRFYEFFLSNGQPFIRISSDGNLLPAPLIRQSIRLAPAERADVIVDFSASAFRRRDTIFIQNRLEQTNGRGPTGRILTPGTPILRFDVAGGLMREPSRVPDKLRELPPATTDVATRRNWVFQRRNGVWTVNNRVFDFNRVDATTAKGAEEIWTIRNQGNGWSHPIHIHFEEFQILSRNGGPPPAHERARKDVVVIGPNETVDVFIRFRDFFGKYPMHCHNLVHEDHAMMMRWDIES